MGFAKGGGTGLPYGTTKSSTSRWSGSSCFLHRGEQKDCALARSPKPVPGDKVALKPKLKVLDSGQLGHHGAADCSSAGVS